MGQAGQVSTSTHGRISQCLWMASGSRMMTPVSFFQVRGWSEPHSQSYGVSEDSCLGRAGQVSTVIRGSSTGKKKPRILPGLESASL
jgi:hypothetical protein